MEFFSNNIHISNNISEEKQADWCFESTSIKKTNFVRQTAPNTHSRYWKKVAMGFACATIIETAALGYFMDNGSRSRYNLPFVPTQSVKNGRVVNMNDIAKWKSKSDLHLISKNTIISKEADSFLSENDFLIPMIISANSKLLEFFPEHNFSLNVVHDPEEHTSILFLSVETLLDAEIALEKLNEFDQTWWLNVAPKANNKLCIDVVFV